ncbi:MAG TPA: 2-aminoethylphosphonate--pyruvate transaminase [Bryobacteraceae bacterium]|nr:2-aminoethylphosphonate--pyruvate transaminase [Bryobacteraceae bacterium]
MKLLFTPGPLTTSDTVKQAMLRDLGSRDAEFIEIVRGIRRDLLELCGAEGAGYETVPMQGSGTFAIEAVISSSVPADGTLLVLINGAYGRRIARIAERHRVRVRELSFPENQPVDVAAVRAEMERERHTHVAVVHCETTTGMVNPVETIGAAVRDAGCNYIVDAMSSLGGIPLDAPAAGIDFLVSSANKCVEGVPGFAFVIARRPALEQCRGRARTLSLDLYDQWAGLEKDGQFRFTPPTHALLAFRQALDELAAEGGVEGRAERYRRNARALVADMRELGFETYLADEHLSWIITTFRYPRNPAFVFEQFYTYLAERGFVIYPGKLTHEDCFRIGTIGSLATTDVNGLVESIKNALDRMNVTQT